MGIRSTLQKTFERAMQGLGLSKKEKPGKPLMQILNDLHLEGSESTAKTILQPAAGTKTEKRFNLFTDPTHGETLFIESMFYRADTAFTIGIDIEGVNVKPAMAVVFKEISDDRFVIEKTVHCLDLDGVVLPNNQTKTIRAITQIVLKDRQAKLDQQRADAQNKTNKKIGR